MPPESYSQEQVSTMQQDYEEAIKNKDKQIAQHTSAFGKVDGDNLVKWQLELDNIMERIDHLLRGHKLTFKNGNYVWTEPNDDAEKIFNDYGVNEILRILSLYLNRNTILSNYDEETISLKVYDFGCEVSDLIMNKYESLGLNSYEKMVLYPMITRELIDVVHSAYLRALKGGERESLREARTVTQSIPLSSPVGINMQGIRSERGALNPLRYVLGKYK